MDESTGFGGEFWLHDGTALAELLRVTEVEFPDEQFDEDEVTTLKSEGKEFLRTLSDGGTFAVKMNYIPASATDTLCLAAKAEGDVRPWKIVVPGTDGTAERMFTGTGFVKGYRPDPMSRGSAKRATLTIRVSGAVTEAAAA